MNFLVGVVAVGFVWAGLTASLQAAAMTEMDLADTMEQSYNQGQVLRSEFTPVVEIYRRVAQAGDTTAMCRLAVCYYEGKGVPVDVKEAIKWFGIAADKQNRPARDRQFDLLVQQLQYARAKSEDFAPLREPLESLSKSGDVEATTRLGIMTAKGLGGITADAPGSVALYQLAAEKNSPLAMYRLGCCLTDGISGIEKNESSGLEWIQKSADAGCSQAIGWMGDAYLKGKLVKKDPAKGLELTRHAAIMDNATALLRLGTYYDDGEDGSDPDYLRAFKCFSRAAELGSPKSLVKLGLMHKSGTGTPRDPILAMQIFLSLAITGNADAQYESGRCFSNGWGVNRDSVEAVQWYSKAAAKKHPMALGMMGYMHQQGLGGLKVDLTKAVEFYQQAADKGDPLGTCRLGFCYLNGTGLGKDPAKAFELMTQAAEKNLPLAMNELGSMYLMGIGCTQDEAQAKKYIEAAADKGEKTAMYQMARNCETGGMGLPKDPEKALDWYRKAADAKQKDAIKRLAELEKADDATSQPSS